MSIPAPRITAVLVLGALLAGGLWLWRRNRDEARLWRQFHRIVALAEKRGPEGVLDAASRARKLAAAFTAEPRFDLPPFVTGSRDREELAAAFFQERAQLEDLTIRIRDRSLERTPDRRQAIMRIVAEARSESRGFAERGIRTVRITWERTDDGWRIAAVETADALRQLPLPP